ncbi:MAG: hypothetical protein CSB33_03255 [Desulfobacterales bacterium]|nr:MAG: hypothetical protein CSB33_03255 [Desulfobacterales bacterium]
MRFPASVLPILFFYLPSFLLSSALAVTVKDGGIAGNAANSATGTISKAASDLAGDAFGILGHKALIMGKTAIVKKCGKYLCTQQVVLTGCLIAVTQQYTDAGFKTQTVPIQNLKAGLTASIGSVKSSLSRMKRGFSNMKNNFKASMTKTLSMPVENPLVFVGVTNLSDIDPEGVSVSGNEIRLRTRDGGGGKVVQTRNINSAFTSTLYVFTDEDKDAKKVRDAFVSVVKKCQ